ncbi:MAG: helix-turn-helix domain-containing protein [Pontibacterium sp.]
MKRIGLLLKRYRQMGDVTQKELAEEIGISHSTLCRMEKGEQFSGENLSKVLKWMMVA